MTETTTTTAAPTPLTLTGPAPRPPPPVAGDAAAAAASTPAAPAALLAVLLALPGAATAVPGNRSVAVEAAVAGQGGASSPTVTLAAGGWLEGEVEALARLTVGSAPRPEGRGAAGAVTPEAGLRWAPDEGRWRPVAALAIGVRLPAAGRATAATLLVQGGVERQLGAGWATVATAGVRWLAGEGAAGEAALGVRCAF